MLSFVDIIILADHIYDNDSVYMRCPTDNSPGGGGIWNTHCLHRHTGIYNIRQVETKGSH